MKIATTYSKHDLQIAISAFRWTLWISLWCWLSHCPMLNITIHPRDFDLALHRADLWREWGCSLPRIIPRRLARRIARRAP